MTIRALVDDFVQYILREEGDDLDVLVAWLDRLAASMESVIFHFDETEYPDAPERQYKKLSELISRRFPSLSYYNVTTAEFGDTKKAEILVADAVDDLADITLELIDVQWYFENTSESNALWHYENGYRFHWARHLRDLQSYLLHARWGI